MKLILLVLVIAGVLLLGVNAPAVMDSIFDFRTDLTSETFQVSTGLGETTAEVALAEPLWNSSVAYAAASSNNTSDTPTTDNYSGRVLTLGGLTANTTRTITVAYNTAGLDEYTGAETATRNFPAVYILALILIPVIAVAFAIVKSRA